MVLYLIFFCHDNTENKGEHPQNVYYNYVFFCLHFITVKLKFYHNEQNLK